MPGKHAAARRAAGIIILKSLKERTPVVQENSGASLIDLGDGVVCCEFHTKMNAIGGDILAMIHAGVSALGADFDAMVIANQAQNFSAGANLLLMLVTAQEGEWDDLHLAMRQFQRATMAIKYAPRAGGRRAAGNGARRRLRNQPARRAHSSRRGNVHRARRSRRGPDSGGGGSKEMLIRANEHAAGAEDLDLFHALKPVFENIAMAKVSTSGEEARSLGYLRPADLVAMNRDRQMADAKQTALAMVRAGYHPPAPAEIRVLGEEFLARGETRDSHDAARRIYFRARCLGRAQARRTFSPAARSPSPQTVSEQYLLDLEREAFVSLCGERKTQERIAHTLKTGKPLRN